MSFHTTKLHKQPTLNEAFIFTCYKVQQDKKLYNDLIINNLLTCH